MRAVKSEMVITGLRAQGIEPMEGGPALFAKYLADETAKWAVVAVTSGLVKP